jgi:hypothetical protein
MPVPVALNDDDHTRLDRLVLDHNAPDYPPALLALVVGNSDGMLDQRYCDILEAVKLLAEHPELWDRIKTAYATQSFKDIRNLGMFVFLSKIQVNTKACRVVFRNTSIVEAKKTFAPTSN